MRRIRNYKIPMDQMKDYLNMKPDAGGKLMLPRFADLPEDAKIVSVWPDIQTLSIGIMVEHPSFDPVEAGMNAPVNLGMLKFDFIVEIPPKQLREFKREVHRHASE